MSPIRVNQIVYCKESLAKIKEGQFGAMMEVNIANDGPVTIEIESLADKSKNTSNDS